MVLFESPVTGNLLAVAIENKIDRSEILQNYYTRGQTDSLIAQAIVGGDGGTTLNFVTPEDLATTLQGFYTRTATDGLLANLLEVSDTDALYYRKGQTDTLLVTKANLADVYTRADLPGLFQRTIILPPSLPSWHFATPEVLTEGGVTFQRHNLSILNYVPVPGLVSGDEIVISFKIRDLTTPILMVSLTDTSTWNGSPIFSIPKGTVVAYIRFTVPPLGRVNIHLGAHQVPNAMPQAPGFVDIFDFTVFKTAQLVDKEFVSELDLRLKSLEPLGGAMSIGNQGRLEVNNVLEATRGMTLPQGKSLDFASLQILPPAGRGTINSNFYVGSSSDISINSGSPFGTVALQSEEHRLNGCSVVLACLVSWRLAS
jgi:hypothetical protein